MANRKDSKGRVLKTGEYQRLNGTYEYKFKDDQGKRRSIYADSLKELREKKKRIQKELDQHLVYENRDLTLKDLIEMYGGYRLKGRLNTELGFETQKKMLYRFDFMDWRIKDISIPEAKKFVIELNEVYAPRTVKQLISLCRRAIRLGIEKELLYRDPFSFKLSDLVVEKRKNEEDQTMSDDQFNQLINDLKGNGYHRWYIPHLVFLRETGLRVSEFCGLRNQDIDWENHLIYIRQQTLKFTNKGVDHKVFYAPLKTDAAASFVPLTPLAEEALSRILEQTDHLTVSLPDQAGENILDGFVILGKHKTATHRGMWEDHLRRITKFYNKLHPDQVTRIYPHKLRHTMTSRVLQKGMSVKGAQKMARHANPNITMSVYAHLKDREYLLEAQKVLIDSEDDTTDFTTFFS